MYRFGSGDATDRQGNRSGQLDVVVEYPFLPSLPAVGNSKVRLYLAEGVAAVIEVKSDLAGQWSEVESTARQLKPLRRNFGDYKSRFVGGSTYSRSSSGGTTIQGGTFTGDTPRVVINEDSVLVGGRDASLERIPLFAVGYTGWKKVETLESHFKESDVAGILVIDQKIFIGSGMTGIYVATEETALWGLICSLHDTVSRLQSMSFDPINYVL